MSEVGKQKARLMTAVGAALLAAGAALGVSGVAFAGPVGPAPPPVAPATVAGVTGGHLDWRTATSASTAPKAKASDGATVQKDGAVRFKAVGGAYDVRTGAARVSYRGTVVLTYPEGPVTLRNPVAELGGSSQAVVSALLGPTVAPSASTAPVGAETRIGELKTFGIPARAAGSAVTWTQIPATLTADGARAFPEGSFEGADLGVFTVALSHAGVPSQNGDLQARAAATTPGVTAQTESPDPTDSSSVPPSDCPTVTPTDSGTPTETPTATPTETVSPTDSPTPTDSPVPTDCVTTPGGDGGGGGDGSGSTTGGDGESLPKTGGALVPMVLTGAGLSLTGGGVMVAARRRQP